MQVSFSINDFAIVNRSMGKIFQNVDDVFFAFESVSRELVPDGRTQRRAPGLLFLDRRYLRL